MVSATVAVASLSCCSAVSLSLTFFFEPLFEKPPRGIVKLPERAFVKEERRRSLGLPSVPAIALAV